MNIFVEDVGAEWEYFPIAAHMKPVFEPDGHGHAELIIHVCSRSSRGSLILTNWIAQRLPQTLRL